MKPTAIIDGEELPDGFGVHFDYSESPLDAMINQGLIHHQFRVVLRAWITRRNERGEYEKHREVTGSQIRMWDERGRAWEYDGHSVTVLDDSETDINAAYGDEESED